MLVVMLCGTCILQNFNIFFIKLDFFFFVCCWLLCCSQYLVLKALSRQGSWELKGESKVPWFTHRSKIKMYQYKSFKLNLILENNTCRVDLRINSKSIFSTYCSSNFHAFSILSSKSNNFTFWDIIFLGQYYFKYWILT